MANERKHLVPRILELISDLFVLNLLTLLTSLPLVTAGASFTAMHTILIRLARNEEGYVAKSYLIAFRRNFKDSTLTWLIVLAIALPAAGELIAYRIDRSIFPAPLVVIAAAVLLLLLMILQFLFPLEAYFDNTITGTLRNAMALTAAKFPRVILMTLIWCLPIAMLYSGSLILLPLLVLFGYAVPGYLCEKIYDGILLSLEEQSNQNIGGKV